MLVDFEVLNNVLMDLKPANGDIPNFDIEGVCVEWMGQ
jgi:hypothetical protein